MLLQKGGLDDGFDTKVAQLAAERSSPLPAAIRKLRQLLFWHLHGLFREISHVYVLRRGKLETVIKAHQVAWKQADILF